MIRHTLIMVAQPGDNIEACAREAIAVCREAQAKYVMFEFNGAAICVQSGSTVADAARQLDYHDRQVELSQLMEWVKHD